MTIRRALTAAAVATSMIAMGATGAQARDSHAAADLAPLVVNAQSAPQVTGEQIAEAFAELSASDLPREMTVSRTETLTTFDLEGTAVTFSKANRRGASETPDLNGGYDKYGMYISFNSTDQEALVNGGAVALGVAICAIPGVGWIACGVVAVIIAIATTYINAHGICPDGKTLRSYPGRNYARCV
jgi:hypothetical protein